MVPVYHVQNQNEFQHSNKMKFSTVTQASRLYDVSHGISSFVRLPNFSSYKIIFEYKHLVCYANNVFRTDSVPYSWIIKFLELTGIHNKMI